MSNLKVLNDWTSGLTEEAAEVIIHQLVGSDILVKRLVHILDRRVNSSIQGQYSADLYKDGSWAYAQAERIGYQKAMNEIKHLLTVRK